MPKITYIEFNGTEHVVDVPVGMSVMEGAVQNEIPGIDADCGGACACATCHGYVDPDWVNKVNHPNEMEQKMVEFASDVRENSRLTCQITVTDDLDGLIIRLPENQY